MVDLVDCARDACTVNPSSYYCPRWCSELDLGKGGQRIGVLSCSQPMLEVTLPVPGGIRPFACIPF